MRTGIYAGSFDPFHKGHKSVIDVVLPLFDKVIVLVAHNPKKTRQFSVADSLGMVSEYAQGNTRIEPGIAGDGAAIGKTAQSLDNAYLIRAIRDVTDLDYERNLASFNRELFNVQTIFVMADPALSHVSSSAIKELMRLRLDYQRYL